MANRATEAPPLSGRSFEVDVHRSVPARILLRRRDSSWHNSGVSIPYPAYSPRRIGRVRAAAVRLKKIARDRRDTECHREQVRLREGGV
jgi:hypothetical protein